MASPFRTTRLVEFSDTDMAGIVHFSAFFLFMEAAEHAFWRNLGYSVWTEAGGDVITFPRVAASCQYQSPAKWGQELDIDVTVRHVGTKSVTYGFEFSHDGRKLAMGEMTGVCCRLTHDGPVSMPIPDAMAEKLRAFT